MTDNWDTGHAVAGNLPCKYESGLNDGPGGLPVWLIDHQSWVNHVKPRGNKQLVSSPSSGEVTSPNQYINKPVYTWNTDTVTPLCQCGTGFCLQIFRNRCTVSDGSTCPSEQLTTKVQVHILSLSLYYGWGRLWVTTVISYVRGRPDAICPPLSFFGLYQGYSTTQRVGSIKINQQIMFEEGYNTDVAVVEWWSIRAHSESTHIISLK